ncbi:HAD-IIIA family hydrolase [Ketogulonicigenium vulgare]|uniref:HAD-IIIA family hydrolase n=1 Tax=Ketogulonicigenium vulgare TaxID=92945 RepID=UPI0023584200|nr:HAD-IIIA family hydrolase [Ketogulonicigenium vulgare]
MLAQAVILCGGLGTRLGELTASTPKPMLPVAGRPFVEYLILEAARYGFKRVTLLAGRFGEQVQEAYDGRVINGARVDVIIEPEPRGTGGALAYAHALGALDPAFLLMNGDSWIDMDLTVFVQNWNAYQREEAGVFAQILLQSVPDSGRYGAVETAQGRVTGFREKTPERAGQAGQINAGVYILSRAVIAEIPTEQACSLEAEVFPRLVAAGQVAGVAAPDGAYFIDIGLPVTYAQVQDEFVAQRTRPALFLDRDGTLNVDRGYTHDPATLQWQPGARAAIKLANDRGYYVFVVTNQAGVARGFYDEDAVRQFHDAMQADLAQIGAHIDALEWCPHHVDATVEAYRKDCPRRKPAPGMINDLLAFWPVDMARSLMIGDAETDMAAAKAAGIAGVHYKGGSLHALVLDHLK